MVKEVKVSVIIPIYNVENYIEKCLETVINQSLKEIEIILVNDGTKDNSIKKIEKFLTDPRITLINKENGGLSSARNKGLEVAKGKYVAFIDSDDFIDIKMLEELYSASENKDVVFSNVIIYDDRTKKLIKRKKNNSKFLTEEKGIYFWRITGIEVWNKIYKTEFLKKNNIKFIEGILYEDVAFTYHVMLKAEKIKGIDKYHYFYRINREGSIMNKKNANIEKSIYSVNKIIDYFEKLEETIGNDEFLKLRTNIWKWYYKSDKLKYKDQILSRDEIKKFEDDLKRIDIKKMKRIEKFFIKEDINKLSREKSFSQINLLDFFYWKNRILKLDTLRRILKFRINNIRE